MDLDNAPTTTEPPTQPAEQPPLKVTIDPPTKPRPSLKAALESARNASKRAPEPTPPKKHKAAKAAAAERLAAARAARAAKVASAQPSNDQQSPPVGASADEAGAKAEGKAESWARERARIGKVRGDWTGLLNATAMPLVNLASRVVGGLDLTKYVIENLLLDETGQPRKVVATADASISLVVGQALATAFDPGVAMEHPWALPIVALLSTTTQIVTIALMAKAGVSPQVLQDLQAAAQKAAAADVKHE